MKLLILLSIGLTGAVLAGEMVYTPANPSFGGNSFNAQWLMSEAQAQSEYKEKKDVDPYGYESDPLKDFQDGLNRQILSRLSREIVDVAFGEEGDFQEGSYQIGDYTINIDPNSSVVKIEILDELTGNNTLIEIPYYDTDLSGNQ
ncbi:MAG: curli production assembly/transport component CsgF [Proteobacteria bacterium]|nr:curli production assembly/transport component CsgF [Pseudomonadota bacterium]